MLNRVFAGGGPSEQKSYALLMNFVRIVDKLVADYERTRANLIDYVNAPNNMMAPLIYATNNCESCITTMIRAIRLGRRIRRDPNGPKIAKKISVLSDAIWNKLNSMRIAIEHIDEQIVSDTWVPDQPVCLIINNDRLELASEEITYAELATWVQQLNDLAGKLALYKEE